MKKGWWHVTYTIEPNDVDLEHIAELIKKGYTQGEMIQECKRCNDTGRVEDPELLESMYMSDDCMMPCPECEGG